MSCTCRYVGSQKVKQLPAGTLLHSANRQYMLLVPARSDEYDRTVPAVEVYVNGDNIRQYTPIQNLRLSWRKYRAGDVLAGEFSYYCKAMKPH